MGFDNNFEILLKKLENLNIHFENDDISDDMKYIRSIENKSKIKFCKADKGGCMVILNKSDYEKLVRDHLKDKITYSKSNKAEIQNIMLKLKSFVNSFSHMLSKEESKFLCLFEPRQSQFYVLPKIHKSQTINDICSNTCDKFVNIGYWPEDLKSRTIVSNIESPTSHLSHFLDRLLLPFITSVPSYVKDSFDFLSKLPSFVDTPFYFISLDVSSLYTVIPLDIGLKSLEFWFDKFPGFLDNRFSSDFILKAMKFILENNLFSFNNEVFIQLTGTAMGTKVAPKYAHLVMGYIENCIKQKCIVKFGFEKTEKFFSFYWRFLDDICIISSLSYDENIQFLEFFNCFNAAFKFVYSLSHEKINFLDLTIYHVEGKIETDIFHKPTDSHQYLHFYSYHPRHIKRNIPYCLANRIKRLVSEEHIRSLRLQELEDRLLKQKYPIALIRDALYKKASVKKENFPVNNDLFFSFLFQKKNLHFYQQKLLPLLENITEFGFQRNNMKIRRCLRQPPNLIRYLNMRHSFCVKKCDKKKCKTCNLIVEAKEKVQINGKTIKFNANMTCESRNVIYLLTCNNCQENYIGFTTQNLQKRMTLHRQQIQHKEYTILNFSKHIQNCKKYFSVLPIFYIPYLSQYLLSKMENYFIQLLKPKLNFIKE